MNKNERLKLFHNVQRQILDSKTEKSILPFNKLSIKVTLITSCILSAKESKH